MSDKLPVVAWVSELPSSDKWIQASHEKRWDGQIALADHATAQDMLTTAQDGAKAQFEARVEAHNALKFLNQKVTEQLREIATLRTTLQLVVKWVEYLQNGKSLVEIMRVQAKSLEKTGRPAFNANYISMVRALATLVANMGSTEAKE